MYRWLSTHVLSTIIRQVRKLNIFILMIEEDTPIHLEIIVNDVCHCLGIGCRTRATAVDTVMDVCQLVCYAIGLGPRDVPFSWGPGSLVE